MEKIKLDKSDKIMLLEAMKRGYFEVEQFQSLANKFGYNPITIEIIDSRDKVNVKPSIRT